MMSIFNLKEHLNALIRQYRQTNIFHISLVKTLVINFRSLPLRDAIKLPVLIYDHKFKISSIGKIVFLCPVKTGLVEIGKGFFFDVSRGQLCNTGTIYFEGRCKILNGVKISNHGVIKIGDNCSFGEEMKIIIWDRLTLGKMNRFAYGTTIMDTSGHPVADIKTGTVCRYTRGITLGDYCWYGNSCKICPGTIIPSHTIVSNLSLLNKDYSLITEYSLLGGIPARVLKEGVVKIDRLDVWNDIKTRFHQDSQLEQINIKHLIDSELSSLSEY